MMLNTSQNEEWPVCYTYIRKLRLTAKDLFIWFDFDLFCCGHILNICASFHIYRGRGHNCHGFVSQGSLLSKLMN